MNTRQLNSGGIDWSSSSKSHVTRIVYPFGEEISEDIFKSYDLSVVENGLAEICQEAICFGKYHAFRPIRLLRPGDAFGVFEAANILCDIPGRARHKETWSVYSGNRSAILMSEFRKELLSAALDPNRELSRPAMSELTNKLRQHDVLKLAYGNSHITVAHYNRSPDKNFLSENETRILKLAWQGCYPYIRGLNYYNREFYDQLIVGVLSDSKVSSVYNSLTGVSKKELLFPTIVSAVVEALERPLYGDPMFLWCKETESSVVDELECYGPQTMSKTLHAVCPSEEEVFFYPIGLENYMINRFVDHWYQSMNTRAKVITLLSPSKQGNDHLATVTNKTISIFCDKFEDHYESSYPFSVSYQFSSGYAGTGVPMIKFTRR